MTRTITENGALLLAALYRREESARKKKRAGFRKKIAGLFEIKFTGRSPFDHHTVPPPPRRP